MLNNSQAIDVRMLLIALVNCLDRIFFLYPSTTIPVYHNRETAVFTTISLFFNTLNMVIYSYYAARQCEACLVLQTRSLLGIELQTL